MYNLSKVFSHRYIVSMDSTQRQIPLQKRSITVTINHQPHCIIAPHAIHLIAKIKKKAERARARLAFYNNEKGSKENLGERAIVGGDLIGSWINFVTCGRAGSRCELITPRKSAICSTAINRSRKRRIKTSLCFLPTRTIYIHTSAYTYHTLRALLHIHI